MSILTTSELILGGLLLCAALLVGFIWLRRQLISASGPLLLCALRTPTVSTWRLGFLRFGPESLDWFSIVGPTMRPHRSWTRSSVRISVPEPAREPIPGLSDPVRVEASALEASADEARFELAMSPGGHTTIRSWMESAPPGFNLNVS